MNECPICRMIKSKKDLLYENDIFLVFKVKSKRYKKVLVVFKHHIHRPPKSIEKIIFRSMCRWCNDYFTEPTYIVLDPTLSAQHWHREVSNYGKGLGSMLELLKTPHLAVKRVGL